MKRLLRKSELDIENYDMIEIEHMVKELDEYVQGYYDGVPDIGNMLDKNQDCKYSGTLYRCVFLDDGFAEEIKQQQFPISMETVKTIAKSHMYKPYEYCSFTKYRGIADDWANDSKDPCITIKAENSGLDVEAMSDKWENYISEEYKTIMLSIDGMEMNFEDIKPVICNAKVKQDSKRFRLIK